MTGRDHNDQIAVQQETAPLAGVFYAEFSSLPPLEDRKWKSRVA